MDYSGGGGMRSPFSPRVRQSISGRRATGLSSAKKNQSKFGQSAESQGGDVIYKTPLTTVETLGTPLPVMVTETLTFASGEVSVRLFPCGWSVAVAGRRAVAWPRDGPARELPLPATDLAHRAALQAVVHSPRAQMPSFISVSPEGIVRYWPSIGQEDVYVDVSAELAGQECDRLVACARPPLVLATTTCTVVLLEPTVVEGLASVWCRTLRPPSGWLGGLGRRVSLLFFGSMPAHADTKLVGVVVLSEGSFDTEDGGCIALVAGGGGGGPILQIWRGPELFEHNLRRTLTEAQARVHLAPQGDVNSLEILALDVRASGGDGLLMLVAVCNVARSPETRHALAHISLEDPSAPRVTSLTALRWAPLDTETPRFLPLGSKVLLYSSKYVAIVSSTISNDKVDYIDVTSEGDRLLCAELCNGGPLLFSRKHGVLALTTADSMALTPSMCESPMGSPCPSDMYDGNLSLYEIDPHEVSMVTTDACGKLKTAFLFHLRRETAACRALVHELFPPPPPQAASPPPSPRRQEERDVDNVLDRTVLRIATEMLDDIPAGDPRWKQRQSGSHTNIALGSSAALQIAAQLRDKQRAFSLFVDFLRAAGLWGRLGLVSRESGGGVIATQCALGALAEQLAIAITLRKLQQGGDAQLIDAAIYQVVCGENPEVEEDPDVEAALSCGALSASDACYRRVSRACRVLRALCAPPAAAPAAAAARACATVLSEVHAVRAAWGAARVPPALGARALLPAVAELQRRVVSQHAHNCQDPNLRAQLFENAANLADLILTEAENLAHSPRTRHVWEKMRRDAIQPFIDEGQTERAAVLAEKFKDFELLIAMCVQSNDLDRLYGYIDKYINEGIAEVAFAWLSDHGGKNSAQLIRSVGARYPGRLAAWLAAVPQREPLLALHHIVAKDYEKAAKALTNMASEETESVQRMLTMASLAKLCLLASDESDSKPSDVWEKVESRLSLGEQHVALPRDIRIHNGLDSEDTRVMPPEDLVQMYIDCESGTLTEYDYKKALDLTDFVEDMEKRDDLRLRIWCACIRHDDWSACQVDAPSSELQAKMFFRLVDLVHMMGGDLEILLPPAEDIMTAPELAELVSDPRFHFIIKYGYECVDTTRNDAMDT